MTQALYQCERCQSRKFRKAHMNEGTHSQHGPTRTVSSCTCGQCRKVCPNMTRDPFHDSEYFPCLRCPFRLGFFLYYYYSNIYRPVGYCTNIISASLHPSNLLAKTRHSKQVGKKKSGSRRNGVIKIRYLTMHYFAVSFLSIHRFNHIAYLLICIEAQRKGSTRDNYMYACLAAFTNNKDFLVIDQY